MSEEPIKEDPVKKFRMLNASFNPPATPTEDELKIAEAEKDKVADPKPEPAKSESIVSKLAALPKKNTALQKTPEAKPTAPVVKPAAKPALDLSALIPKKQPKADSAKPPTVDVKPTAPLQADPKPVAASQNLFATVSGPRLWTTASLITLTVNIILALVLIILIISVYRMKLNMTQVMDAGTGLLQLPAGLYSNFEKMERANIQTNVVVDTVIPVKFDLELNQQTNVILSQDVTITNALVTVNTGGLNISRANTTIVLPAGTTLPVNLSLTVPVDKQVPVTLNVPVNIPLKDTQLNDPFVGLQNVIRPLYCVLEPQAVNMDGTPICP